MADRQYAPVTKLDFIREGLDVPQSLLGEPQIPLGVAHQQFEPVNTGDFRMPMDAIERIRRLYGIVKQK